MIRSSIALGICLCLPLLLMCPLLPPSVAQPEAIDPQSVTDMISGESPEKRADKEWKALRTQMKEAETREPLKAVSAYSEFLTTHRRLSADRGVDVHLTIARLHEGLKDVASAEAVYDAGLKAYAAQPPVVYLVENKARLLGREKRGAEAAALLEAWWPRVASTWTHFAEPVVRVHGDVLKEMKQPGERARVLQRGMVEFPYLLSGRAPNYEWIFTDLNESLGESKAAGEALSWAKLRFMTCPYEAEPLDRASRMLAQSWSAADPERKGLLAFAKAQKEAGALNPLHQVALPEVQGEVLERVSAKFKGKPLDERNIWRILSGTPQGLVEAMAESRALCDSPNKARATEGALEVCRVFKASDLHLRRATAFLKFLKSREGEDPTVAFIQEQGKPVA